MLFAQSPAWAHHKDDHEGGRAEESQEDSETTEEESSTSEAEAEEDGDDAADDGASDDSNDGWSSYRSRTTDDRDREATASTTTTTSSTNPGGQVCDGSPRQESGGGANQDDHPYMSNCQGLPSGNGQGKARPCAGCVGAADDKFPPGQAPDASDHNNGYECDGNNGIAKTNPAHTGCDSPPPPSVCDANPATPMIEECISGNPPEKPPGRPPVPPGPPRTDVVLPRPPIFRFPNPPDVVLNRPPATLPVTGASPLAFLLLGLGMIGTGAMTLGQKRVRRGSRRKV